MGRGMEFGKQPIRTLNFYFRETGTVGFEYQNNLFKFLPYFIFRLSLALSSVFLLYPFLLVFFMPFVRALFHYRLLCILSFQSLLSPLPFLVSYLPPSSSSFLLFDIFRKGNWQDGVWLSLSFFRPPPALLETMRASYIQNTTKRHIYIYMRVYI